MVIKGGSLGLNTVLENVAAVLNSTQLLKAGYMSGNSQRLYAKEKTSKMTGWEGLRLDDSVGTMLYILKVMTWVIIQFVFAKSLLKSWDKLTFLRTTSVIKVPLMKDYNSIFKNLLKLFLILIKIPEWKKVWKVIKINSCWMWHCCLHASSYLLRARCAAFEGGPFKGAGVHAEDLTQDRNPSRVATGQGTPATSTLETDRNTQEPLQHQVMAPSPGFTL